MNQPPLFPMQRWWRILVATVIVGAIVFTAWKPTTPGGLPIPTSMCIFHEATGLPCALCGGTRAAAAILHGDFRQAAHLNAVAFPVLLAMVVAAVILAWEALRGRAIANWKSTFHRFRIAIPIGIALLIIWWIPQMVGAVTGAKKELIDLRNPIARYFYAKFSRP